MTDTPFTIEQLLPPREVAKLFTEYCTEFGMDILIDYNTLSITGIRNAEPQNINRALKMLEHCTSLILETADNFEDRNVRGVLQLLDEYIEVFENEKYTEKLSRRH